MMRGSTGANGVLVLDGMFDRKKHEADPDGHWQTMLYSRCTQRYFSSVVNFSFSFITSVNKLITVLYNFRFFSRLDFSFYVVLTK